MCITSVDIRFDFRAQRIGQAFDFCIHLPNAIVRVNAEFGKRSIAFVKHIFVINGNRMPKKNRIGDFHHRWL